MYEYRAKVLSVHDGDTINVLLDLGMDVHINVSLRLNGIDAPELNTPAGRTARDYLRDTLLPDPDTWITVQTVKDRTEKYGRYLATIYDGKVCLNDRMVETKHAVPYSGGKRNASRSNED